MSGEGEKWWMGGGRVVMVVVNHIDSGNLDSLLLLPPYQGQE